MNSVRGGARMGLVSFPDSILLKLYTYTRVRAEVGLGTRQETSL